MLKKTTILFFLLSFWFASSAAAQEGGHIVLELEQDSRPDESNLNDFERALQMGADYISDVKEYNDQLEGKSIDKDFSEDIHAKYPSYDDEMVEQWQKYVKKGLKSVRFVTTLKDKIVSWILNQEMPIVVPDNQYEMGGAETYIESDKPLVVQNFKKVVAYSHAKKDRLASEEKFAKDHKLPLVSDKIKKYKKALLEQDWETLLGFDWKASLEKMYEVPKNRGDVSDNYIKAVILSQFEAVDSDGTVSGVLLIKPSEKAFVLLSDYRDYSGLKIDFSKSENLEDAALHFVLPQRVRTEDNVEVLGYTGEIPVYFTARVREPQKSVVLRADVEAFLCREETCQKSAVRPEVTLLYQDEKEESLYSSYVKAVAQNVPLDENKKYFSYAPLVLEKGEGRRPDVLRLEVETDDAAHLKVFMIGEHARRFSSGRMRVDNDKAVIRYDVTDNDFDPLGHDLTFWTATKGTRQYLARLRVENAPLIDVETGRISVGILLLAFVGGLLLNLMPCVFPVFSLKLLSFTKFGGTNASDIRCRFMYNSFGILVSVLILGVFLTVLKSMGVVLGWGMQFQNIYFICAVIWIVTLFFAHILGLIHFRTPAFVENFLSARRRDDCYFEFLSGVFLVLLSTSCTAPYLGTALGIALAGSLADIWLTLLFVGGGLAFPYVLIALRPDIAKAVPRPGKWMNWIFWIMTGMVAATLCWLVAVLAAQSLAAELWHWGIYIVSSLIILAFRKAILTEIGKLKTSEMQRRAYFRFNVIFGVVLSLLVIGSMVDTHIAAGERQQEVEQIRRSQIDFQKIETVVKAGGKVLVKVGADWCLTCKYNDWLVFNDEPLRNMMDRGRLVVEDVDWTRYDPQVVDFMTKFGRQGIPFYVLFSQKFPDGVVLPELPSRYDVQTLMEM